MILIFSFFFSFTILDIKNKTHIQILNSHSCIVTYIICDCRLSYVLIMRLTDVLKIFNKLY